MIDLSNVKHHRAIEEIANLISNKTQNTDLGFFRPLVAYYLAKMASCMRANIVTKDRGKIPINAYVIDLGLSGTGKGYSVNIMEDSLLSKFKKTFLEITMPKIVENNLVKLANNKAVNKKTDPQKEYDKLLAAYERAGAYPFTFDSGTAPAVKQLRSKLLLANCGAINFQCDEIGSNLLSSTEILNTFLELYDQGLIKQKLTKNTTDNIRDEDLDGKTPANMLLFGTPVKLFDGGQTEDIFYSMLDIGYARRCIFGLNKNSSKSYHTLSAQQIYQNLTQPSNEQTISLWSNHFSFLALERNFNKDIIVDDDVAIKLLEYKIECERLADTYSEYDSIKRAELSHRYFKALKLAGAYAFVDSSAKITEDHLLQAILLVEESGKAFEVILNREKNYMKLAKYIAESKTELTHADLTEALPFYKSSSTARNELMSLASAWGYKRNILIKKSYIDGIEFFKGESLQETDLDKIIFSISDHVAYNYISMEKPFDKLITLGKKSNFHWCNHHFIDNHRCTEKVKYKFNLLVVDVDGTISINMVKNLLNSYKFMLYTTKRHTPDANRFRLIFPMKYVLSLDPEEYGEFMKNVFTWLPFKTDEQAASISKKWETNDSTNVGQGEVFFNDGILLDTIPFIPKTSKNEYFKQELQQIESFDNFERWFAQNIGIGNRNNQILKYALALVDSGLSYKDVYNKVNEFNSKLKNGLTKNELDATIFITVKKKYSIV